MVFDAAYRMTYPGKPEHSRRLASVKAELRAPRSRSQSLDTGLCASAGYSAIRGMSDFPGVAPAVCAIGRIATGKIGPTRNLLGEPLEGNECRVRSGELQTAAHRPIRAVCAAYGGSVALLVVPESALATKVARGLFRSRYGGQHTVISATPAMV